MSEQLPERVVCAANHFDGVIVLGLRHNDEFMQDAVKRVTASMSGTEQMSFKVGIYGLSAQGFLTNRGRWVDRKQAYELASDQDQILRKTGGMNSKVLYSEDVY